jgi:hypothetical protein
VLIQEFEVDEANLHHLAERAIALGDLDAMLESRIAVIRNKRSRSGSYKFVGRGLGGRALTVVVTRTSTAGRWRPITGWESTNAERKATATG